MGPGHVIVNKEKSPNKFTLKTGIRAGSSPFFLARANRFSSRASLGPVNFFCDYDMGSFADFRSVRACHIYAAGPVKHLNGKFPVRSYRNMYI